MSSSTLALPHTDIQKRKFVHKDKLFQLRSSYIQCYVLFKILLLCTLISPPTKTQGGALTPLLPRRCRWPCCSTRERLFATAVGGLVIVGGGGRPRLRLPSSSFCCRLPPRCCCCCWCARFLPRKRSSPSPTRAHCSQRRLAVVVLSFHPRSNSANSGEQRPWGCMFIPLVLVMHPISTPRAVARGGSSGCCRGVSSIPLFVVPLSTLRVQPLLSKSCSNLKKSKKGIVSRQPKV